MKGLDDLYQQQKTWLINCLQSNQNCTFAQSHHFSTIKTIKDYQQQVPLHRYQDIEPMIQSMADDNSEVLFSGTTVAFEKTSGSSSKNKLIPYSQQSLRNIQAAIQPWLKSLMNQYGLNSGSAYWSLSPHIRAEKQTKSGIPIGLSDLEFFGDDITQYYQLSSTVPDWVGRIDSFEDWQLITLYFLIRHDDLVFISIWSPSFFTSLIEGIDKRIDAILNLLRFGGQLKGHALSADKAALKRLKAYQLDHRSEKLWPHLKLVSCWSDASSKYFKTLLQKKLPYAAFQGKGLISTEGIVTLPDEENYPVLSSHCGFFEFISNEAIFLAHELKKGCHYEVVMTTSGGLYRYQTDDVVVCEGYRHGLPILRFQGRVGIQSDLVGEKLNENFVSTCLADLKLSGFAMLLPCHKKQPHYIVLMDKNDVQPDDFLQRIELKMRSNVQYDYARKLGQLGCIVLKPIAHPEQQYLDCMMHEGMRLGDIKIPALSTNKAWIAKVCHQKLSNEISV